MDCPSGLQRIHNSQSKKKLVVAAALCQRMNVTDELKPSLLLLYATLGVMESVQIWQHSGASRGPAGASLFVCVQINVYLYMFLCVCNTRTHIINVPGVPYFFSVCGQHGHSIWSETTGFSFMFYSGGFVFSRCIFLTLLLFNQITASPLEPNSFSAVKNCKPSQTEKRFYPLTTLMLFLCITNRHCFVT